MLRRRYYCQRRCGDSGKYPREPRTIGGETMTTPEDTLIDTEIRDEWWSVGEAVMKEMCDEDD